MLNDIKQTELDLAEEKVITAIFGSKTPSAKAQWLLNFLGIDLQKKINEFEYLVMPMMTDEGKINSPLAKSLMAEKYPFLANIIPDEDFRLVDIAEPLSKLIGGLNG